MIVSVDLILLIDPRLFVGLPDPLRFDDLSLSFQAAVSGH